MPEGDPRHSSLTNRPEVDAHELEIKPILDELYALRNQVPELERLRQENEKLKADIARLRNSQTEASAPPNRRAVLGALSPNKPASSYNVADVKLAPENDASDVAMKYKKLKAQFKELYKANEGYKAKLRDRNETIDKWADRAEILEKRIQALRDRLKLRQITGDSSGEKDEAASIQDGHPDLAPPKSPGPDLGSGGLAHPSSSFLTFLSRPITSSSPERTRSEPPPQNNSLVPAEAVIDELVDVSRVFPNEIDLPPHLGLQGEDRPVTIKAEPASDGPIFISTRTVRKRRRENEEAEPRRIQKIKSEHSTSSDFEAAGEQSHSPAAESIDYEKEVHVPTPRKRRALSRALRAGRDGDEDPTPYNKRCDLQRSTVPDFSTPDTVYSPLKFDVRARTSHRSLEVQRNEPELLWPPASPSLRTSSKVSSHHPSRLNVGVMDLAEDGEDGLEIVSHPVVKGRLDTLLNPPTPRGLVPVKQRELASRDTSPCKNTNGYEGRLKLAPRRELPFKQTKAADAATGTPTTGSKASNPSPQPSVVRQRGPKRPSILRDDMPRGRSTSRESTPLRERPVDGLRPEDFKPNPRYNDGLTYVFDEVVRGKEARAALSGCIDPNCCGKTFRHFAEAERKTIGASVTSRAEDIKLLERYLGDEAWRLSTMSPDEKEETWLYAKTRELANKFGKHRQRYSRMPTPPGFWDVSFPSTQERAEERRQAEEIRTALVRERYREAMRSNGAWLFRDEEPH